MATNHVLGTGLLSWPNTERIGGRYGLVALFSVEGGDNTVPWNMDVKTLAGKQGTLVATMNGQEYDLGAGTFFTEQEYGHTYVGLKPDDGREDEWLNVENLYKVDFQLSGYTPVVLTFVEAA